MDTKKGTAGLPAVVCILLLAAGVGAKEGRKPDSWITTKVKATLATHKNVNAIGTNVDTKNGVVTLKGEVKTLAEKDLAARYAREVEGVRSVNNMLMIKGEERADVDSRESGEGVGDAALNNMGDAALTGRVKAALAAQRATSAIRTNVDTERGAVTLRGTAKSGAERDLAEKVVRDVKGVRSVENRIEVK